MKRTLFYIFAVVAVLALFFVIGQLRHTDDEVAIHPETPITIIHVDGTEETGPLREMKNRVLRDGDRIIVGKLESQTR